MASQVALKQDIVGKDREDKIEQIIEVGRNLRDHLAPIPFTCINSKMPTDYRVHSAGWG